MSFSRVERHLPGGLTPEAAANYKWSMSQQLIPFRAVSHWLPILPRSVYQAHRRKTANFLTKQKVGDKEVGQWLFDPHAYTAQLLAAGRQVPRKTQEAIDRALLDQQEAQR